MRPFKLNLTTSVQLQECDIIDLRSTVEGLIELFIKFLYKNSFTSAEIILTMFVTHLKHHYEQTAILEHLYIIRYLVRFIDNKYCI